MRGVDHRATVAAYCDETGLSESVEVKCECVWCNTKFCRNLTGGHAARPRLNQHAVDIETVFLREGGERHDGLFYFHLSTNMEMYFKCQLASHAFGTSDAGNLQRAKFLERGPDARTERTIGCVEGGTGVPKGSCQTGKLQAGAAGKCPTVFRAMRQRSAPK